MYHISWKIWIFSNASFDPSINDVLTAQFYLIFCWISILLSSSILPTIVLLWLVSVLLFHTNTDLPFSLYSQVLYTQLLVRVVGLNFFMAICLKCTHVTKISATMSIRNLINWFNQTSFSVSKILLLHVARACSSFFTVTLTLLSLILCCHAFFAITIFRSPFLRFDSFFADLFVNTPSSFTILFLLPLSFRYHFSLL